VTRLYLARLSDLTRALFAASAGEDIDACERLIGARTQLVAEIAREFRGRTASTEESRLLDAVGVTACAIEAQLAVRRGELGAALAQLREAHSAVRAGQQGAETRSTLGRA
jgi:hypothetical protein